ncbi:MAG TPA: cupin domain-containing protein [Solirubrobacterales bacterium]|jgi:quercetin dioxygenase-like cupin family protein|nr:cupin domain-containing protein [Solirubrobacterales bacterium]
MSDDGYEILHRKDFETNGKWQLARKSLGIGAFGMNVVTIPPGESIPEHNEEARDHEEVFIVLRGNPTMVIDGEKKQISEGTFVRVDPKPQRTVMNETDEDAEILIISAPRSSGYEPLSWA